MEKYSKLSVGPLFRQALPRVTAPLLTEKQIEKLKTFGDVMLAIAIVAGVLTVTAIAPKALMALQIFEKRKGRRKPLPKKQQLQKITRAFYYLKQNGRLMIERKDNDYVVRVTKLGRKRIRQLNFQTLVVGKPARWDRCFWQVAADIPTKEHKNAAEQLRRKLKDMKFYPLQRTLWFHPFDPRVEIEFVSRTFGIFPFVTVMKIVELDAADRRVMERFFRAEKMI